MKCLYEANELNEALKLIESVDGFYIVDDNMMSPGGRASLTVFDDTPKNVSEFIIIIV